MSDKTFDVSRRKVLGSIGLIGAGSAAAGAGTMAYFSDSEKSSGNTVQAGTINLGMDSSRTVVMNGNMAPGESTSGSVTLTSDGSLSGSLDIAVSYTENDGDGSPDNPNNVTAEKFAKNLYVTSLEYGGSDISSNINDSNGDSNITLHELANNDEENGDDLVDLADPGNGTDFAIELMLNNVGNDFQNDGVDIEFTFTLNQTTGQ